MITSQARAIRSYFRIAFLCSAFFLFSNTAITQSITVTSTDVIDLDMYALADDHAIPPFEEAECAVLNPAFGSNVPDWPMAFLCNIAAKQSDFCEYYTTADAQAFCGISGSGSSTVLVRVVNFASTHHNTAKPIGYDAYAWTDAWYDIDFEVSGLPIGTPVTVHYRYDVWAFGGSPPEAAELDYFIMNGSLFMNGTDLFAQDGFNMGFNNVGANIKNAFNNASGSGSFSTTVGDSHNLYLGSSSDISIEGPGKDFKVGDCGAFGFQTNWKDAGTVDYSAFVWISVDPVPSPVQASIPEEMFFSVDVGSDKEMSSPFPDGSQVFDPGDAYLFSNSPLPPGGASGAINDADYMG